MNLMVRLDLGFGMLNDDFGQGLGFDNEELQGLGFQINHLSTQINPIDTIQYNLESGQQNLSDGQIGFRVQDLKDGFWLGFRI